MGTTPSQSAEDYLERIHELIQEKGYARVVDIASSLHVRQASVTSMVQKLGEAGYLNYVKYRSADLTERGREVARSIQQRHATLSRFFSLFGIDPETQKSDIEGIEHHLSPETLETLAGLAEFFEQNPEVLKAFLNARKSANVPRCCFSARPVSPPENERALAPPAATCQGRSRGHAPRTAPRLAPRREQTARRL